MNMPTRSHRIWTQEQINFLSDIIAAGVWENAYRVEKGGAEQNPNNPGESGVEITFSISQTFKGRVPTDGKLVVRHYCSDEESARLSALNLEAAKGDTYLLFLRNNGQGEFEPTSGTLEPSISLHDEAEPEPVES